MVYRGLDTITSPPPLDVKKEYWNFDGNEHINSCMEKMGSCIKTEL